ncbi:MAG TPA: YebC/PmpR family DNA-binding transcriptional regulator [Myxococcota bacterium]|jgi:YebC/PmpR family DNA-binding regulatory protein|nr:YebC/PmpR family DNA-binding transcriptional regulator [Myxococcota bacterium]
MSGHSKWATIKRKKGAADAKRGKVFTKLIREIATAARLGGGDPNGNPRLRLVMDKARAANMPKDNIERAIQKGIGGGEGDAFEEVVYEGYGPGGTAIMLRALTDNRNRTVGEVRHVLTKYGGNLGSSGCVAYLFEKRGLMTFERRGLDPDALLEAALEAGAVDVVDESEAVDVVTAPGDLEAVRSALSAKGFTPASAEVSMEPGTTVKLQGEQAKTMLELADALDDLDDVQGVYANFDISDEEMARLA